MIKFQFLIIGGFRWLPDLKTTLLVMMVTSLSMRLVAYFNSRLAMS